MCSVSGVDSDSCSTEDRWLSPMETMNREAEMTLPAVLAYFSSSRSPHCCYLSVLNTASVALCRPLYLITGTSVLFLPLDLCSTSSSTLETFKSLLCAYKHSPKSQTEPCSQRNKTADSKRPSKGFLRRKLVRSHC